MVRYRNGFLEFKDEKAFETFYYMKGEQKRKLMDELKQQGFVSMPDIYSKAQEAEIEPGEQLDAMTPQQQESLKGMTFMEFAMKQNSPLPEILSKYPEVFYIPTTALECEINLPTLNYGLFVNTDGIFKVGKEIRKFSKFHYKVILDGDESKISSLKNYSKTSKEDQIFVSEVIYGSGGKAGGREEQGINRGCSDIDDGNRLRVEESLVIVPASNGKYYASYSLRLINERRRFFADWIRQPTCSLGMLNG